MLLNLTSSLPSLLFPLPGGPGENCTLVPSTAHPSGTSFVRKLYSSPLSALMTPEVPDKLEMTPSKSAGETGLADSVASPVTFFAPFFGILSGSRHARMHSASPLKIF